MARTELLYDNAPQMRRLAEETITDQESEIQLMQLWLSRQKVPKKIRVNYKVPARFLAFCRRYFDVAGDGVR